SLGWCLAVKGVKNKLCIPIKITAFYLKPAVKKKPMRYGKSCCHWRVKLTWRWMIAALCCAKAISWPVVVNCVYRVKNGRDVLAKLSARRLQKIFSTQQYSLIYGPFGGRLKAAKSCVVGCSQ